MSKRSVRRLGASTCAERLQAAQDLLGVSGYRGGVAALERELKEMPATVQGRAAMLLKYIREAQAFEEAGGYEEWLRKTVGHAWEGPAGGRAQRYHALKDELVQIARDRSKGYFVRRLAITTIAHLVSKYEGVEETVERDGVPVREWRSELFSLQHDGDQDVRVTAAILAGGLGTLSDAEKRLASFCRETHETLGAW